MIKCIYIYIYTYRYLTESYDQLGLDMSVYTWNRFFPTPLLLDGPCSIWLGRGGVVADFAIARLLLLGIRHDLLHGASDLLLNGCKDFPSAIKHDLGVRIQS